MATEIRLSAGATEQDIAGAIAQLSSGGTVVLPSHETIRISQGLKINVSNRDVTIDLNGSTLQQAGNVSVIWGYGTHKPGQSAVLGASSGNTTVVTYAGASEVGIGDYVKIYSDDVLRNDHGEETRLGQALKVIAVQGDTVTLEDELLYREDYKTNIRASAYSSGELVIKNGTIEGDQSQPTWILDLVNLRTTVGAKIDHLTVQNGNSMGINVVDSVNATITDAVAKNLKDNPALGFLGYGVHSASSVGTTVIGLYAENVRHATDDNSVGVPAGHVNPSRYGADIGMTVVGTIAYETSSFAYSWHSEGRKALIRDSMAFDSHGLLGARGVDNSMVDSYGVNTARGIQLYEYGDGDAYGFVLDGIRVKEATVAAFTVSGSPHDNLVTDSVFEVTRYAGGVGTAATLVNSSIKAYVTNFNEILTGTDAADVLLGGQGVDAISGGAGADYIWGGSLIDLLTGGSGRDYFVFHRLTDAGDVITDFQGGASGDFLDLSVISKHYGWNRSVPLGNYVRFVASGADTIVQIDVGGGADSFTNLVTLMNIQPSALSSKNILLDLSWGIHSVPSVTPAPQPTPTPVPVIPPATPAPQPTPAPAPVIPAISLTGDDSDGSLTGGGGNDTLRGLGGNDQLWGFDGDDLLIGDSGADVLTGGGGIDEAAYHTSSAGVTIDLSTGLSRGGDASGDLFGSVENLIGSRFADYLGGDNANNTLYGLEGNDMLRGEAGDDILVGGLGADSFTGGSGRDAVSYHNADNSIRVVLFQNSGRYSDAEGDAFGSIEDIYGSAYADELMGDNADNYLAGLGGHDNLEGDAGNDSLEGGDGFDKLYGQDGDDSLNGGLGQDRLFGGAGADTFVFASLADSTLSNPDEIVEFTTAHGDKIDLTAIDANTLADGDQPFWFIGDAAFIGFAGQLHYVGRFLEADVDGNGTADFRIQLNVSSLAAGDFLL